MRQRWQRFRTWLRRELSAHLTPSEIFWACFLGVFIGCTPFWGLHVVTCIFLARVLRLNQPLVLFTVGVSNPVFGPPLLAFEAALGSWLLGRGFALPPLNLEEGWEAIAKGGGRLMIELVLGSAVVGPILGAATGFVGVWLARVWRHERAHEAEDTVPADPEPG